MTFGGRVTLAFLGTLTVAIGGSVIGYLQFANHRPLVIVLGAIVVIFTLMEAAYRRWDIAARKATKAEQTVADLRAELDRSEVGPKHHALIEDLLRRLRGQVEQDAECVYGAAHDRAALAAHFPDLPALLDGWDAAVCRARQAPEAAQREIENGIAKAEIPARYNRAAIAKVWPDFVLGGVQNPDGGYRVVLKAQQDDFGEEKYWSVMMQVEPTRWIKVAKFADAHWKDISAKCESDGEALNKVLESVVDHIRQSGCVQEITEARSARQVLQQPLLDTLALKQAVSPIPFAQDCAFCQAQRQAGAKG